MSNAEQGSEVSRDEVGELTEKDGLISRKAGEENMFQTTVEMPFKSLEMFDYKEKSELQPVLMQRKKMQCDLCKVMVVI